MALKRRVAVVGLGSIGQRHARLLLERADVKIEIVEPNPEILAAARGQLGDVRVHESFAALLDTGPDVVWLCTPTDLHAAQSIAALEAGAHVFCEKPMAYSLAEARQIKLAAERARGIFNVGFYLHFWRGMQLLKELIDGGALGTLLHLHARVGTYITLVNSLSRYQARQPGALFFDYAHQPDLFYWLTGHQPATVYTAARQSGELEFSSEPNVADVICEYDAPLITHLHLNYAQMPQRHEYEIVGDRAWALVDFERGALTLGRRQEQSIETQVVTQARDDIFRAEHQAFFDAVDGKRPPATSAADGMVSTAVCAAALRSYREQQKIKLE